MNAPTDPRGGTPRLGVAFYPEYLPGGLSEPGFSDRVRHHLDLMREVGISLVRVGESVWSTWEPRDGQFDLGRLTPVLDAAHQRDIDVILGTPTYAIPPWLQRKHPELAVIRQGGDRLNWGSRQEVDFTSPTFRGYAERVIRAMLGTHGPHPSVVGVQLDNEPGLHLIANEPVLRRFREHLRGLYGTVEALNEAWGLTYWSHRIAEWDELWPPAGNSTPAFDLAWRRFQAGLTTEFIGWQVAIAREVLPSDRFLTTCIAYNRAAVDDVALGGVLDVVSGNCYLEVQDSLHVDAAAHHGPDFWYSTTPSGLFQQADRMRSSRQGPFLITETGATSIAGSHINLPPYAGQLSQVAWALIARGAQLVSYWHWHTLHHGAEQTWGGILGHDLEPGRVAGEVARIGDGLRTAGDAVAGLRPIEEVGFLFSRDSRWAMQFQPPLAVGDTPQPDLWSHDRIQDVFAAAAFDAGLQCGVVAVEQLTTAGALLARFPVLVAAGLTVMPDDVAGLLSDYVELGGRLVVGPRTGVGDALGGIRAELAPGPLRDVAGVSVTESSNVRGILPLSTADGAPAGTAGAWADGIELEGANGLLRYDHPHFGRWWAAAEHAVGDGAVLTVGTLPDRDTAALLLGRFAGAVGGRSSGAIIAEMPRQVSAHGAVNSGGDTVWFLHNWSGEEARVDLREPLRNVLAPGHPSVVSVPLAPWGVAVLVGNRNTR